MNKNNTVQCRHKAVQHNMILHVVQQGLRENMHQRLYSRKTPYISPSRAYYGVSFVSIWVQIDRVIMAPHGITLTKWKHKVSIKCKYIKVFSVTISIWFNWQPQEWWSSEEHFMMVLPRTEIIIYIHCEMWGWCSKVRYWRWIASIILTTITAELTSDGKISCVFIDFEIYSAYCLSCMCCEFSSKPAVV